MPRDEYSDLRAAYAAATGVTLRTAQRHQRQRHPDWERFMGVRASEAVRKLEKTGAMDAAGVTALAEVSPNRPIEVPAFVEEDDAGLHPVQIAAKRAWQVYEQTYESWKGMLGSMSSQPMALVHAKELTGLRADWEKARAALDRWEVENRRLIPVHEFESFVRDFLLPLAELLRNLDVELPLVVNPDNPGLARARLLDWKRTKAEPQIQGMLNGSVEFLAA